MSESMEDAKRDETLEYSVKNQYYATLIGKWKRWIS